VDTVTVLVLRYPDHYIISGKVDAWLFRFPTDVLMDEPFGIKDIILASNFCPPHPDFIRIVNRPS
jgi:hypothetical protein